MKRRLFCDVVPAVGLLAGVALAGYLVATGASVEDAAASAVLIVGAVFMRVASTRHDSGGADADDR